MRKFQSFSQWKLYRSLGLVVFLVLLLVGGAFGLKQTVFADSPSLAVASPTPTPLPTVMPSPTAMPSPPILAVTPGTHYTRGDCTQDGKAAQVCTFTLRNVSSTSTLVWTAHAWNPQTGVDATRSLLPANGILPPGVTSTATLGVAGELGYCTVPAPTIDIQFTGPQNSVTVTVVCS
jgi:hypothetical protein